MTFEEFSKANRERCESKNGFKHPLDAWTLSDWFMATMGELGEAANVAKKLKRIHDGVPVSLETEADLCHSLKCELADVFIYLDLLFQAVGMDLESSVREVFNRKSAQIGYDKRI